MQEASHQTNSLLPDQAPRKSMYRLRKEGLPALRTWPPTAGYYERRIAGRWVPIRIWAEVSKDPETDEPLDRSPQWAAEIDGIPGDINWTWPECSGRAISREQYLEMVFASREAREASDDEAEPVRAGRGRTMVALPGEPFEPALQDRLLRLRPRASVQNPPSRRQNIHAGEPLAEGDGWLPGRIEEADAMKRDLAQAVDGTCNNLGSLALDALRRLGPMTADECADAIGTTPLSLRPRFSELHKAGHIDATGLRRSNASGRLANVWQSA